MHIHYTLGDVVNILMEVREMKAILEREGDSWTAEQRQAFTDNIKHLNVFGLKVAGKVLELRLCTQREMIQALISVGGKQ